MPKEQRLVFGEVAELYDKARPTYPAALIDYLATLVGAASTVQVLDVGCGTGKATVLMAQRGFGGVGVEPDLEMAAMARRNLAPFPNWLIASTDFEAYQPGNDRSFDLLTSAQAWHWLDPSRRFQQAARLLRLGGWLALFWNRTGNDAGAVRRAVDEVYAGLFPMLSPHGWLTAGHPPVGAPPPGAGFGPSEWHVFPWIQRYTTTEWTDLVQTHSDHRLLDPQRRAELIGRLAHAIDDHGGIYDHPYECWLWSARRVGETR